MRVNHISASESTKSSTQEPLANQASADGEVHMKDRLTSNRGLQNLREGSCKHQALTKPTASLCGIKTVGPGIAGKCWNMAKSYVSRNSRTDQLDHARDSALYANVRTHADNLNLFRNIPVFHWYLPRHLKRQLPSSSQLARRSMHTSSSTLHGAGVKDASRVCRRSSGYRSFDHARRAVP